MMKFFRRNRQMVLTGNSQKTILAEVVQGSASQQHVNLLAQTNGSLMDEATLPRLLASAPSTLNGEVAVTLPLDFFATTTVALPMIPDSSIARTLPYHLGKTLHRPLTDYIYDWQVTKRHRDRLNVAVYLFPVKNFTYFKNQLLRKQAEITFFEADIFTAFGLLENGKRLKEGAVALGVILWPESISLAVFEGDRLPLFRTVRLPQPTSDFHLPPEPQYTPSPQDRQPEQDTPTEIELNLFDEGQEKVPVPAPAAPDIDNEELSSSVLAEFQLVNPNSAKKQKTPAGGDLQLTLSLEKDSDEDQEEEVIDLAEPLDESSTPMGMAHSAEPDRSSDAEDWLEYLQGVNLEVIRTRDYYSSVLKGTAVKEVFILGGDTFWNELAKTVQGSLALTVSSLAEKAPEGNLSQTFSCLCRGAGTRWL